MHCGAYLTVRIYTRRKLIPNLQEEKDNNEVDGYPTWLRRWTIRDSYICFGPTKSCTRGEDKDLNRDKLMTQDC